MSSDPLLSSSAREVDDVELTLISFLDSSGALSVVSRVDALFTLMCRIHKVRIAGIHAKEQK